MTAETFEYAIKKDVRNNPIVREIDRERNREMVRSVGVGVFLATWDIPPPSAPVQKEISNDRLRP